MRGKTRLAVTALIGYFLAVAVAHACGSGKVIYQDDFKTLDPAWNAPDYVTAANGAMSVKLAQNTALSLISQANLYTQPSIEICATFKLLSGPGTSNFSARAGVAFWASSPSDYTEVEIFPYFGTVGGLAKVDDKWITKVSPHSIAAESTAIGGTNDMDVVVNGSRVQASVNGKPSVYMLGTAPTSSWLVGLYFASSPSSATEWQVTNFQVREGL
jgi:hypothetical protein